jgi:hypothetical protein
MHTVYQRTCTCYKLLYQTEFSQKIEPFFNCLKVDGQIWINPDPHNRDPMPPARPQLLLFTTNFKAVR